MYSDIIRGEAMIICGFIAIFFENFHNIFPKTFMLKGRSIFLYVYFLDSLSSGVFQFILNLKYI